jgi:hypothetical protein
MLRTWRIEWIPAALVVGLAATAGWAQDWASPMFDHTSHDFGVVAWGAAVEHHFPFKNPYVEDVHVKSVESGCPCTTPQINKPLVKTHETGEIVAVLDTRKSPGRREATLKVIFDRPFLAEVRLHVSAMIRGDVVFEPGAVRFGTVSQGDPAQTRVSINYKGRGDWQILDIQSDNRYLAARLQPVGRNLGQINYDLWLWVKSNVPVGYLKDHVIVVTNERNPQTARILLDVEGMIVPPANAVVAGPSVLSLVLAVGETVQRKLVVRGKAPFQILDVSTPDGVQASCPKGAEAVHVIPVSIRAGNVPGALAGKIRIRTDAPGYELLEVPIEGQIRAATGNK